MGRVIQQQINTVPPGGDYPYGRIRDDDGTGNGTPVDESVYGDIHQFFARLLSQAGIPANGLPDNNYSGYQFFEALIKNIRQTLATEILAGCAEIATLTEVNTGTDDQRFVTPLKLKTSPKIVEGTYTNRLKIAVFPIGDWNMDADPLISVPITGIPDVRNVVNVKVVIKGDSTTASAVYNLETFVSGGSGSVTGSYTLLATVGSQPAPAQIDLNRANGSFFDSTSFDSTSYNRGWIYITYFE